MRTKKKLIFKIHGEVVESMDGMDIDIAELENLKITMAFAKNVSVHDIEVDTEDIQVKDLATNLTVGTEGLFFKAKGDYSVFRVVDSITPTVNIKTEDGYHYFLDMIFAKDIDNALTFQ